MKKVLSIFLTVVLIFSISSTAFAKTQREYVPIITVYGFGRTDLVKDKGLETEQHVFLPDSTALKQVVKKLLLPLCGFLFFGNDDCFAKAAVETANELFEDIRFDDNGEPVHNNISLERDSENLIFRYDWRFDVMDIADDLNDYIEYVKDLYFCDKVALAPESMGTAVTMAYLWKYGYESVDTLVLRSSAMYGITFMGEFFTKNICVDPSSVLGFINGFIQGSTSDAILKRSLVTGFADVPVKILASRLNSFIESQKDYIYDESLKDLFGNLPGIWSFVPTEYYEQAKATMLDETENAKLIEKIDVYHYQVRPNIENILKAMQADGIKVAVISNYGLYGVPLVKDGNYSTDFLVDTKFTSCGATCALIGENLGDDYVQAFDDGHNHISPDGQIDASTCILPDNTWFIKGMVHTWYNDGYRDLVRWIVYESVSAAVYESENYPQFLYNNIESKTLEPLRADSPNPLEDKVTFAVIGDWIKNW